MNNKKFDKIILQVENRKEAVDRVLGAYCSLDGCPCGFKKFVYWAGKEQGPGWMDNIQNQLVDSAVKLDCFSAVKNFEKEYWLEGVYYCKNCGTVWKYFSQEWRMLAFHNRLLIEGGRDPDSLFDELAGGEVFATAGREPEGKTLLTLVQWEEFMLKPVQPRG